MATKDPQKTTAAQDTATELTALRQQLAEAHDRLKQYESKEEGYLLVAPNPAYNGMTGGVEFRNGMAFLPNNAKLPRYSAHPLTEGQFNKLSAADKAAHKAESAKTDAQRAAEIIAGDFGYKLYQITQANKDDVMAAVNVYHQANASMIEAQIARAKAEGLLTPLGM